jgi:hypothetical protein
MRMDRYSRSPATAIIQLHVLKEVTGHAVGYSDQDKPLNAGVPHGLPLSPFPDCAFVAPGRGSPHPLGSPYSTALYSYIEHFRLYLQSIAN